MKKLFVFFVTLFILLPNKILSADITIKIISENHKRESIPVFDLLSCEDQECKKSVQVFLDNNRIIKAKDKIIIKNVKKGRYLLVIHKDQDSIYYFEKNSYNISLTENNKEVDIKEYKGGSSIIDLYNMKNKPFIPFKSKFINIWFDGSDGRSLFYRFDKLKDNRIIINGIPEDSYVLNFLYEGFGIRIMKNIIIKKGKKTRTSVFFNVKSKTGIEGRIVCGDILKKEATLSLVELIKNNKKGKQIKFGTARVDKDGNYKIIDIEPGEYSLFIHISSISPEKGKVSLEEVRYHIKIRKNRIERYISIIDKENLKKLGFN